MQFVACLAVVLATIIGAGPALGWKQLTSPTSFSISQQHPAIGGSGIGGGPSGHHHAGPTQHTINALSDGGGAHSSSSITFGSAYEGDAPTVNTRIGHGANGYLGGASDDSVSSEEDTQPRILHPHHRQALPQQPLSSTDDSDLYETNYYGDLGAAAPIGHDQCSAEKFAVEHEGTVQYEQTLPKLDQFTLCAWMRFTNHTGDHTVLTYALPKKQREIQFWIANSNGASYFSLAVHGQSLYRLNYPLKMRHWHHACTSWNGKTGEWQLWVKAERVGRGFHNRIVGHTIAPHGILYSGGPSPNGPVDHDLHMEVTMIQMYKVALSAGKAHRDHKHHHVHHFNHDGLATSTAAPANQIPQIPLQPINPLLANGQIATRLRINLAGTIDPQEQQQQQQVLVGPQHATVGTSFVSGQFSPAERYITQQLVTNAGPAGAVGSAGAFKFPSTASPSAYIIGGPSNAYAGQPQSTQQHVLFKRHNAAGKVQKRQALPAKRQDKRALVQLNDGSVYDDAEFTYEFDGLAQFGAPAFQAQLTRQMDIEDEIKQHDREPAEGEVAAVLDMCSICAPEPFQGAIIFAWKDVKGLTKGALRGKTLGGCGHF